MLNIVQFPGCVMSHRRCTDPCWKNTNHTKTTPHQLFLTQHTKITQHQCFQKYLCNGCRLNGTCLYSLVLMKKSSHVGQGSKIVQTQFLETPTPNVLRELCRSTPAHILQSLHKNRDFSRLPHAQVLHNFLRHVACSENQLLYRQIMSQDLDT